MSPEPITIDQNYLEKYANSEWMETHTGRQFWPARPRMQDLTVFDIAHALSLKCRYGGHTRSHYSVAEHCTVLALYARHMGLSASTQFQLLMHDANEAYLPDVCRPIKHFFTDLILMEKNLDQLIRQWVSLPDELPEEVKQFDSRIIRDEREQCLMPSANKWQTDALAPLGVRLHGYRPIEAESRFLQAYQVIACDYLTRPVLLAYSDGEFADGHHADTGSSIAPNIQLIDVLGSCAMAKDEDGRPYYFNGDFKLFTPRA